MTITTTAKIGLTVLVADMSGDRPAIITKVLTSAVVEVCAFMPNPFVIDALQLHGTRAEAINASQADSKFHGYWPAKA